MRKRWGRQYRFDNRYPRWEKVLKRVVLWGLFPLIAGLLVVLWRMG